MELGPGATAIADDKSRALSGGSGSLASANPRRAVGSKLDYATTLWDWIRRAMPFTHAKSLTAQEVYALTAYVLNLNESVPYDTVLNRLSLLAVQMPNRDGYTTAHDILRVDGKPDVRNTRCLKECLPGAPGIMSRLPDGCPPKMYGDIRSHFRPLAAMVKGVPVAATPTPLVIAGSAGCLDCHGVEQGLVGPAHRDVARRCERGTDASTWLAAKIRQGGAGVWGSAMMPPQSAVADADR
jgi:cytochrome c